VARGGASREVNILADWRLVTGEMETSERELAGWGEANAGFNAIGDCRASSNMSQGPSAGPFWHTPTVFGRCAAATPDPDCNRGSIRWKR
jgi:hypothetical protein